MTDVTQDLSDPDDLFSIPIDGFVAARDRLASRLRAEGDTAEATRVKALRKPTISAWALNVVARNSPGLVEDLVAAHARLRGSDSVEVMRTASAARNAAVEALMRAAASGLEAGGRPWSAQTRDRVANTLLAVATDPQGEADLRAARLAHDLEPAGTGWGDIGLPSAPTMDDESTRASTAAADARERADRLAREADEAERRLETARQALTRAGQAAKEARARAQEAAEEADRAEREAGST